MPTADLILVLVHKVKITPQLDLILVVLTNQKCELMKVTTYCVRELKVGAPAEIWLQSKNLHRQSAP